MRFMKMKITHGSGMRFFCILAALLLSGCISSEVECDSAATKDRIIGDFKSRLSKDLPEGAMDYITNIELVEITTLAADKDAGSRSCEAEVVVHTRSSDLTANQGIKYINNKVSGGDESTRTQYVYFDTFKYISGEVFKFIRADYERDVAKENGFGSYSEYREYSDAKNRLKYGEEKLGRLSKEIADLQVKIKEIYPSVAQVEQAIRVGKTVVLSNEYFSMEPILVNVGQVKKSGFDDVLFFSAEVKNLSGLGVDDVSFTADVFIDNKESAIAVRKFVTVESIKGLKPGEVRKVNFSVRGGSLGDVSFLETTAWKEAKSVQVILTPELFVDDSGNRVPIGNYRDLFALGGQSRSKGEPIVWQKYMELYRSLRRNTDRLAEVKSQIERDKGIISSRDALK